MPEISVIVPVYKVEPYLRRCVDSILNQTFTDFELILVDDGSPDNCPAICDEYAALDPRVRVIHQENGGLSAARNAGIENAVGKYVMFCDSDDSVDAYWCEYFYRCIEEQPKAWIMSNIFKIDCSGKKVLCENSIQNVRGQREVTYYEAYDIGLSGFSVNKIYSMDVLNSAGIRFDESCRYAEDVAFNVWYYKNCEKAIYMDTPLYNYYLNPAGITGRYYPELFELRLPQFSVRLQVISSDELTPFCDSWLYTFIILLENVFDQQNSMSFFKQMRYNHRMVNTREFQFCLHHASGKNENPWVIRILKTKNYYLYWLFDRLVKLKRKLRGEKK